MRANGRALVTLNTIFGVPRGYFNRYAAFFESGRAGRNVSVGVERGRGKFVALKSKYRMNNFPEIFIVRKFDGRSAGRGVCPFCGNGYFFEFGSGFVDSGVVHVDDRVAFLAVGLLDVLFHPVFRFGVRHDFGVDLEERGLHDSVGSSAETYRLSDLYSVDNVEFRVLLGKRNFHRRGKVGIEFFGGSPFAVKKELAVFFKVGNHIVSRNVRGLRACDEVGGVDKVGRLNRSLTETKVRNGYTARLLTVVEEVTLSVHIRMVADNLDRVLVRADRTVRTQTVELTTDRACGRGVVLSREVERSVGYIVVNTDSEVILRLSLFEVFVNRVNHGRVEFF